MNAQLLGMIIVSKVYNAAMARASMPENERKDFYQKSLARPFSVDQPPQHFGRQISAMREVLVEAGQGRMRVVALDGEVAHANHTKPARHVNAVATGEVEHFHGHVVVCREDGGAWRQRLQRP